jgi:hypothetical protein
MSAVKRLIGLLSQEGSTRTSALIRIGLPLLMWSRLGADFMLFRSEGLFDVVLSLSFFLSTSAMLVGFHSRLSTLWTGVTMLVVYYVAGMHQGYESYTHHHVYLLAISPCLLACTECGRSWSLDRVRAVAAARALGQSPPPERGPTWGLWLITLQLSQIYLWSAVSKCTSAFLSGERLEHIYMALYTGSDYPALPGFHEVMILTAVGVLLVELALAVGMFMRRTHRWLLPIGILFHGVMVVTLPVATFSVTMWLLYLAVLDPDRVHTFMDGLQADRPQT